MAYPNDAPALSMSDIWTSGNYTPEDVVSYIIDDYRPINKNSMRNSLGYQVSLLQNYVNSTYLGRATTPIASGYISNLTSSEITCGLVTSTSGVFDILEVTDSGIFDTLYVTETGVINILNVTGSGVIDILHTGSGYIHTHFSTSGIYGDLLLTGTHTAISSGYVHVYDNDSTWFDSLIITPARIEWYGEDPGGGPSSRYEGIHYMSGVWFNYYIPSFYYYSQDTFNIYNESTPLGSTSYFKFGSSIGSWKESTSLSLDATTGDIDLTAGADINITSTGDEINISGNSGINLTAGTGEVEIIAPQINQSGYYWILNHTAVLWSNLETSDPHSADRVWRSGDFLVFSN